MGQSSLSSVLSLGRWVGLAAFHESVLDLSTEVAESAHAASALTCSPLGLERPVVASDLARGVAGGGTSLLLLVPVLLAAIATQRVRLVAAFSLSLSSLRLYTSIAKLAPTSSSSKSKHGSETALLLTNLKSKNLPLSLT